MFSSQVRSLIIVTTLATHGDSSIKIELQVTRRLDELFELLDVLQFCVAIQQQCCMIWRCFIMFVELLKIINEVMDPLSIQKLGTSVRCFSV